MLFCRQYRLPPLAFVFQRIVELLCNSFLGCLNIYKFHRSGPINSGGSRSCILFVTRGEQVLCLFSFAGSHHTGENHLSDDQITEEYAASRRTRQDILLNRLADLFAIDLQLNMVRRTSRTCFLQVQVAV